MSRPGWVEGDGGSIAQFYPGTLRLLLCELDFPHRFRHTFQNILQHQGGMMDTANKVRENRVRRAVARQGYRLVKIRRRDPCAIDMESICSSCRVVRGAAR
jgi:hypothetical protein